MTRPLWLSNCSLSAPSKFKTFAATSASATRCKYAPVLAIAGSADSWLDIAVFWQVHSFLHRRLFGHDYNIPAHDTLRRLFVLLSFASIKRCFRDWLIALRAAGVLRLSDEEVLLRMTGGCATVASRAQVEPHCRATVCAMQTEVILAQVELRGHRVVMGTAQAHKHDACATSAG